MHEGRNKIGHSQFTVGGYRHAVLEIESLELQIYVASQARHPGKLLQSL